MDKGDGMDIHTMSRTRDNSTYATAAYAAHGQTAAEHRVTKNPKGPFFLIFVVYLLTRLYTSGIPASSRKRDGMRGVAHWPPSSQLKAWARAR